MRLDVGQVPPGDVRSHLRVVPCREVMATCCMEKLQLLPHGGARTFPLFVLKRAAHPGRDSHILFSSATPDLFELFFVKEYLKAYTHKHEYTLLCSMRQNAVCGSGLKTSLGANSSMRVSRTAAMRSSYRPAR